MNVLEKILEEINEKIKFAGRMMVEKPCDKLDEIANDTAQSFISAYEECSEIIRSHMDEIPNCKECSRRQQYMRGYEDGKKDNDWIPVEEKLPESGEIVEVTVHSSEWIADYDSDWVPEEEKTRHEEEYNVYYGYLNSEREWVFYDDENSENICDKEFGTNKGKIYDVVTAWRLKTEPYIKNPK